MFENNTTLMIVAFAGASSLIGLFAAMLMGRNRRLEDRMETLSERNRPPALLGQKKQLGQKVLPALGSPLMPTNEKEQTQLRARLVHAGYYSRFALPIFLGAKMLLMILPIVVGF